MLPVLHVLGCMVLGVLNTGGGCGPGGDPLPPVQVVCTEDGASGVEPPPDPNAPFVWLGTTAGEGTYRALTPNETLPSVSGPQGGSHVWGAARLFAPGGGLWTLHFTLTGDGGGMLGDVTQVVEACPGSVVEVTNITVFLRQNPPMSGVLAVDAAFAEGDGSSLAHAEVPIAVE